MNGKSPCPDLHPKLAEVLAAFRQAGITLDDREIVWLALMRKPCDDPGAGGVPWVMGAPLDYAGMLWYPLHRLAESWFVRMNRIYEGCQLDQIIVYLYAHVCSAPGDTSLRLLMDKDKTRDHLRSWYNDSAIHHDQLDALAGRLRALDGDSDTVPDPDRAIERDATLATKDDMPAFVATMLRVFNGTDPDFWMSGIGAHDAREMLSSASDGGDFATSAGRTAAISNFLKAVRWLWKVHTDG